MYIDNYFLKFLKMNLNQYWRYNLPVAFTDADFSAILNYQDYLRKIEKTEFRLDDLPDYKELQKQFEKGGGNKQILAQLALIYSNHLTTLLTNRELINKDLQGKVQTAQHKYAEFREYIVPTLKDLYKDAKYIPEDEMQRLKDAFKAGQDSMEGYIKHKDAEHEEDVVKVKPKHNFNYWANQIWKYGKAKGFMHPKRYKKLKNEEDMPNFLLDAGRGKKPGLFKKNPVRKAAHNVVRVEGNGFIVQNNNMMFGQMKDPVLR